MDVLLGDGVGVGDLDWAADVESGGREKWGPIRFAHGESVLVVPMLGGGSRGWLLPSVMEWAGMPDGYKATIEGLSRRVEEEMLREAKKWHDVEGNEAVKGMLMEECCGYWYTFAAKGGIAPHPIGGEEDLTWVCEQVGKATSWIQRQELEAGSGVRGADGLVFETPGRPDSVGGWRLLEVQRVRQVLEEKAWIPIHSVARESILVVKEEDVG